MATWDDLASYLRSSYKIMDDGGSTLKLLFEVGNGRSQIIHVGRARSSGSEGDWASIASVFGNASELSLRAALSEASEYLIGGLVLYGDNLALRHTVPLANLDLNEFEEPFQMVMHAADAMEQKFVGGDSY